MKNLNFRQEWHGYIRMLPTEEQIEVYNALFHYNATGEMPAGLSDNAAELINRVIMPVLLKREKAAEYRRRKAAGNPVAKKRKPKTGAIPLLATPAPEVSPVRSAPETTPAQSVLPRNRCNTDEALALLFGVPLNHRQRRLAERLRRKRRGKPFTNDDLRRIIEAR